MNGRCLTERREPLVCDYLLDEPQCRALDQVADLARRFNSGLEVYDLTREGVAGRFIRRIADSSDITPRRAH